MEIKCYDVINDFAMIEARSNFCCISTMIVTQQRIKMFKSLRCRKVRNEQERPNNSTLQHQFGSIGFGRWKKCPVNKNKEREKSKSYGQISPGPKLARYFRNSISVHNSENVCQTRSTTNLSTSFQPKIDKFVE
ncbi:hypothetical protein TNCV_3985491 [Trichonephila clavipes]|nr:hypothetical protein TNCV_3985491 [Trichonephila clavipes]